MCLLNGDAELKREAWQIVGDQLEDMDTEPPVHVALRALLGPGMWRNVALWFLQDRKAHGKCTFLNPDQLVSIASNIPNSELDIDELPGVYMFLSAVDRDVLKVGQTKDMRRRIAIDHLRKGTLNTDSLLRDYMMRRSEGQWPQPLYDREVTALLFPMPNSDECDRSIIEACLRTAVNPLMP